MQGMSKDQYRLCFLSSRTPLIQPWRGNKMWSYWGLDKLSFGPKESDWNSEVVIITWWLLGGVPLYVAFTVQISVHNCPKFPMCFQQKLLENSQLYLQVFAPKPFHFSCRRIYDPDCVFWYGANNVSISENIRWIKCAVNENGLRLTTMLKLQLHKCLWHGCL